MKKYEGFMGVGRRLGGGLALSVAGTRKVCPDGVDSCGDPFRRRTEVVLLTFHPSRSTINSDAGRARRAGIWAIE